MRKLSLYLGSLCILFVAATIWYMNDPVVYKDLTKADRKHKFKTIMVSGSTTTTIPCDSVKMYGKYEADVWVDGTLIKIHADKIMVSYKPYENI